MIGEEYGRLTVLDHIPKFFYGRQNVQFCRCRCQCGKVVFVTKQALKSNHTRSCGCLMRETSGKTHKSHGMSDSSVYNRWQAMLSRCHNIKDKRFYSYGGRGIFVCRRWKRSFKSFHKDMGVIPSGNYSLDRINNNLGYIPFNCKWSTPKEQSRNTRTNKLISYKGETLCVSEWAEKIGMESCTLSTRLRRGWSIGDAIERCVAHKK